MINSAQKNGIINLCNKTNVSLDAMLKGTTFGSFDDINDLTREAATALISRLNDFHNGAKPIPEKLKKTA